VVWDVESSSNVTQHNSTTLYTYTSAIIATTNQPSPNSTNTSSTTNGGGQLTQQFSSSALTRSATFAGLNFTVLGGRVKWSINISAKTPFASGLTMSYLLSDIVSPLQNATPRSSSVKVLSANSANNLTTYLLALGSAASPDDMMVAQVEAFNVALINNNRYLPINHTIILLQNNSLPSSSLLSGYMLVLEFPPFEESLFYDPTVGLGVLLASGSGGGSTDIIVIAGVTAGGAVLAVVLVLVVVAPLALWWRGRHRINRLNFVDMDPNKL